MPGDSPSYLLSPLLSPPRHRRHQTARFFALLPFCSGHIQQAFIEHLPSAGGSMETSPLGSLNLTRPREAWAGEGVSCVAKHTQGPGDKCKLIPSSSTLGQDGCGHCHFTDEETEGQTGPHGCKW